MINIIWNNISPGVMRGYFSRNWEINVRLVISGMIPKIIRVKPIRVDLMSDSIFFLYRGNWVVLYINVS
jgi:hypothetical protein